MKRMPLYILAALTLFMYACKSDDPEPVNEEELITTLIYELTPADGGSSVTFSFTDLDGDGGDAPVIVNGTLAAGTSYSGKITMLNETKTPPENITEEVEEESEEHQFFFQVSTAELDITYNDQDADGLPIGIDTNAITTDAGTGSLIITLRHEPNKTADGVSDGRIANAGGETDIEVTFQVVIE